MAVSSLLPSVASAGRLPCGTEITQDTTLAHNVVGCSGDGLVIAADNVTLDLAGHKISGSGAGDGVSVRGSGDVVKNGKITGFDNGVRVGADGIFGGDTTLNNLTLVRNGDGVLGLHAGGGAGVGQVTVTDSRITDNSSNGLYFEHSASATVIGNRIARNGRDGIGFLDTGGGLLQDNDIVANGRDGVHSNISVVRLIGNRASRNIGNGIYVFEDYSPNYPYWFADNAANHNGELGIAFLLDPFPPNPAADGGGNTAKANGDARECVGITCSRKRP